MLHCFSKIYILFTFIQSMYSIHKYTDYKEYTYLFITHIYAFVIQVLMRNYSHTFLCCKIFRHAIMTSIGGDYNFCN